jgi:hypothetical protein
MIAMTTVVAMMIAADIEPIIVMVIIERCPPSRFCAEAEHRIEHQREAAPARQARPTQCTVHAMPTARHHHGNASGVPGRAAILKVMKNQPAVFLKLLVLLVPRELEVTHSAGVKGMTDEQIEQAIEMIEGMLAKREAGENAKVVEGVAGPPGETPTSPTPRKTRKKRSDASPMLPDAVPGEDGGSTP